MIDVRATGFGVYESQRRKPGDEFQILKVEHLASWMVKVKEPDKEPDKEPFKD